MVTNRSGYFKVFADQTFTGAALWALYPKERHVECDIWAVFREELI